MNYEQRKAFERAAQLKQRRVRLNERIMAHRAEVLQERALVPEWAIKMWYRLSTHAAVGDIPAGPLAWYPPLVYRMSTRAGWLVNMVFLWWLLKLQQLFKNWGVRTVIKTTGEAEADLRIYQGGFLWWRGKLVEEKHFKE
jgi:hypothetical protein